MSTLYLCPSCGHNESKVRDVRMDPDNGFGIIRKRVCLGCGSRYRKWGKDKNVATSMQTYVPRPFELLRGFPKTARFKKRSLAFVKRPTNAHTLPIKQHWIYIV